MCVCVGGGGGGGGAFTTVEIETHQIEDQEGLVTPIHTRLVPFLNDVMYCLPY